MSAPEVEFYRDEQLVKKQRKARVATLTRIINFSEIPFFTILATIK